ncbi:hypothetical protein QJS04_geneDACA003950 [Acorus gramineus]|uniref:Uncharacterized protein n=1 Tax=Acorus gramineus TaxID=55184 RepID=A0AAV9BKL4_ACOGR|nr:hypothetical protein QJS04_geneDACA003950 [Acorus gramineus]
MVVVCSSHGIRGGGILVPEPPPCALPLATTTVSRAVGAGDLASSAAGTVEGGVPGGGLFSTEFWVGSDESDDRAYITHAENGRVESAEAEDVSIKIESEAMGLELEEYTQLNS